MRVYLLLHNVQILFCYKNISEVSMFGSLVLPGICTGFPIVTCFAGIMNLLDKNRLGQERLGYMKEATCFIYY